MCPSGTEPLAPGAARPVARVIASPPREPGQHVHAAPAWLSAAVRASFAAAGATLGVLAAGDWPRMPPWAQVLSAVLSPAMVGLALWRAPWRNTPKFVAGPSGVCFPCNELLVMRPAGRDEPSWLLVPWDDVDNLRLSRSTGDDGSTCVAFDVRLDAERAGRYMGRVASPDDRRGGSAGLVHVAFDDALPSPRRTLNRLVAMRDQARGYSV